MEPNPKHFVGEVAQKAIIEKDGKVLIQRHPGDAKWDLPGGRIHLGEKPLQGLMREVFEELGVEVTVGAPVFADLTKTDYSHQVERYFVAFKVTLKNPEQPFVFQKEEVEEVRWVSKDELESASLFLVSKDAIETYFNLKH